MIKLANRGFSFGKSDNPNSGAGLGLSHAIKTAEAMNGSLTIKSELNKGTEVLFTFPECKSPTWFANKIDLRAKPKIVVVDDDSSIHMVWRHRLSDQNIKIVNIYDPNELIQDEQEGCLYLIDYEFLNENTNGLEIIENFSLQTKAILVTSHAPNPALIVHMERLKIQYLPKQLVEIVPILS